MGDEAELTRLTTALGVQQIDGKTLVARSRVSGGGFYSRGEKCRGSEGTRGVRAAGACGAGPASARKLQGKGDGEGGLGGGAATAPLLCIWSFSTEPPGQVFKIKTRSFLLIFFSGIHSFSLLKQFQIKFPWAHNYY